MWHEESIPRKGIKGCAPSAVGGKEQLHRQCILLAQQVCTFQSHLSIRIYKVLKLCKINVLPLFFFFLSFHFSPFPLVFTAHIGACGGNYTSATAVIYSPDFPDTYGTGKVCYWTIQVPGASQIHFSFVLFEIKDATDMVELLDGYTYHVLARFNGKNRPPHTFNISLDFVILYFFSDDINQAQGFAIRYRGKRLPLLILPFSEAFNSHRRFLKWQLKSKYFSSDLTGVSFLLLPLLSG